jgi:catechol 2,3-dioxygenase
MSSTTRTATLPATLRLGAAHLTVTSLDRALAFYTGPIGLHLHRRGERTAGLGAGGEDLIVLVEEPGARPAGRHAGLYHVALLHPCRDALAQAAQRLAVSRTPILGASDHGISEAIYLKDPDGNELELAADRSPDHWAHLDETTLFTAPLDLDALVALEPAHEPERQVREGTVVGHVHLHVSDVDEAVRFYRGAVGFEERMALPTASFLAAGGYHHHVAVNVWRGRGIPPMPPGTVGLRRWTVVLDSLDEVEEVAERVRACGYPVEQFDEGVLLRDPDGIPLLLVAA